MTKIDGRIMQSVAQPGDWVTHPTVTNIAHRVSKREGLSDYGLDCGGLIRNPTPASNEVPRCSNCFDRPMIIQALDAGTLGDSMLNEFK